MTKSANTPPKATTKKRSPRKKSTRSEAAAVLAAPLAPVRQPWHKRLLAKLLGEN